jgi:hypothetical protein
MAGVGTGIWAEGGFGAASLPVAARGTGTIWAPAAATVTTKAKPTALKVLSIPHLPQALDIESLTAAIEQPNKLPVH